MMSTQFYVPAAEIITPHGRNTTSSIFLMRHEHADAISIRLSAAPHVIDPFLSCLACDITVFTRIFQKIRAKNVISQTREDKRGAMFFAACGS